MLAYIDDTHVEELRLVDTHHVDIINHQQDVLAAVHRRGLDHIAVMAHYVFIAVAHVNSRFVNLHAQFGKLGAFHAADELLRLAGEHRTAYYLNGSPTQTRAFGVSFGKHKIMYDLVIYDIRFTR